MGINVKQLRELVIKPALQSLELYSKEAEDLLMEIACQESLCGHFLHQTNGPALGIFQVEPATHKDLWENFLEYKPTLRDRIKLYRNGTVRDLEKYLETDLLYAAMIARLIILRIPAPIPTTRSRRADYWKQYYNTPLGAGTIGEYLANANTCLGGS